MHDTDKNMPHPIKSQRLEQHGFSGGSKSIVHGFFNRSGGVSTGIYRGLNVGSGSQDEPSHIQKNRERVAAYLGVKPDHLVTVHQVHSADVITISEPLSSPRPKADALVTNVPGLAIGALTADCGPILFADNNANIIGAAHAGWRGALNGILENTITAMIALGAKRENIVAALGPCIGPDNYEVGAEFREQFLSKNPEYSQYFAQSVKNGHYMFNLWQFIMDRLKLAGVQADNQAQCTYANEQLFFSYRRTTHRREPDYGRQIAAIAIKE